MAFDHFGENADVYVQSLSGNRDEYEYAQAYLRHLRSGKPLQLPRGHTIPAIIPSQEHRIIKRLRNTGTSEDFAQRRIGGTAGTFRRKSGMLRTKSRAARRAGKR